MIANTMPARAGPSRPPPSERDYLSYSAIAAYRRCPLSYFFKYVAGLPEETESSSLVFGAGVHRAIEHHFRELMAGNAAPSLDDLFAHYRAEWQARGPERVRFKKDESSASLDNLARRILSKLQASEIATPRGTILGVEERLCGQIIPGLPDLLGIVDLIVETPDEITISDWKTSRARWSERRCAIKLRNVLS